jgi:hypothetical protein
VNRTPDIDSHKHKDIFDKKSVLNSFKLKRSDEKILIEDPSTYKNNTQKDASYKIKVGSSSPLSSYFSKNIQYNSNNKIESVKNVGISHKLSLKDPNSINFLSLQQNRVIKSRSHTKDPISISLNAKNSIR